MTTHRRLAAALVGLLVVALSAGGCTVTAGNSKRDSDRKAAEQILGNGLEIDLTAPPTREDLGLPGGRSSTVLQRADREPFDVTVRFRDGHVLRTTGVVLMVTADSPDGEPTSVTVRRDGLDLADLRGVLDDEVTDLGADRSRADAILTASRGATQRSSDVIRTLPTAVAPPDRLELESVVSAQEGRVSVNHLVSWEGR